MIYLTPEDVEPLLERLGFRVRFRHLLLSALAAPMPVFGEEVYPRMQEKAAALIIAINGNHPIVEGNKRTSWILMNLFLALNGYKISATEDEAYDFVLAIAEHGMTQEQAAEWIGAHLVVSHGEARRLLRVRIDELADTPDLGSRPRRTRG